MERLKKMQPLSEPTLALLRRLLNKRRIGGKHTEEKNCFRWIKNLPHDVQRQVYKEWKWCVNEGWVLRSMKTGEFHVSLNPRRLRDILEAVR